MGGAMFAIRGELSDAGYAMACRRGWFSRALGVRKPREYELAEGMTVVELPSRHLPSLRDDFRRYLGARIAEPWPATQNFLDYLSIAWEVSLRGERAQATNKTQWSIAILLSGCAGMADVSASLGTHWLAKWYGDESQRLGAELLGPVGFSHLGAEETVEERFLPVGKLGYAVYYPPESETAQYMQDSPSRFFELDGSALELLEQKEDDTVLRKLDELCADMMADGNCRCQLCAPELDRSYVDNLRIPDGI